MCPQVNTLKSYEELQTIICVTGQHRQMLDKVTEVFHVVPDYDLSIMKERQPLFDITVDIPLGTGRKIQAVLAAFNPGAFTRMKNLLHKRLS